MVVREGRPAFIDCPFNNTYYVWRINNTVYGVSNLPPPYEASLALDGLNFTAERSINGTAIQCLTSLRSGSLEIAESTQVILIVEPVGKLFVGLCMIIMRGNHMIIKVGVYNN